ncbi:MAG: glycosyltransferase [Cyanobacteria bacterium REEB65]|nr:glycosyltransferase [Cyanobacteria bacterium REEB65]
MRSDHVAGDGGSPRVAVLLPCYNEARVIGGVVSAFRAVLPEADIYVYDNNSTDDTASRAAAAGAIVRREPLQGKGNVVRRMFADIEADIYVLVDGDGTYDPTVASPLVRKLLDESLDMINIRRESQTKAAYRPGHRLGNWLFTRLVGGIFGDRLSDILSGYRVFSRRFVKSFPSQAAGFEIESELTIHALELRMPIAEVAAPYRERGEGSLSKLSTFKDGFRILGAVAHLVKEERPLSFFGSIGGIFAAASLVLAWPVVAEYLRTGLVPRLPTAVLATGLMLSAGLCLGCGLILETVTNGRREAKRMCYLSIPGPAAGPSGAAASEKVVSTGSPAGSPLPA